MKRIIVFSFLALLGLVNYASAWGGGFACINWGIHCIEPPCPPCPDCSCPCDKGLHLTVFGPEHAHKLIAQLCSACCCDRIKAAENLGSRLHADFCCVPEVLSALTNALANDPCWEVRRAAAWSIARQKARTEEGVLALYLASKLDPHYMVRDAATDALAVLLVCRRECFKELFVHGDQMVKALRGSYKPGQATATAAPARPSGRTLGEQPPTLGPTPPAPAGRTPGAQPPAGGPTPSSPPASKPQGEKPPSGSTPEKER